MTGNPTGRNEGEHVSGQGWFWDAAWQADEREADRQSAAGEGTVYDDGDAFMASLGES